MAIGGAIFEAIEVILPGTATLSAEAAAAGLCIPVPETKALSIKIFEIHLS